MGAILLVMVMLFSRTQSSMEGRNLEVLKEGEISNLNSQTIFLEYDRVRELNREPCAR